MSTPKQTKVLIAGGSIAGLTLANILEKLGIDFLVLEKYGKIAPDVGASIGIFPNGFRILDQIGCHDAIEALIADVGTFNTSRVRNEQGQVFTKTENANRRFIEELGYDTIFVDRQMIIQVLYDNLRDKSKVLTSKGVAKIEQSPGEVRVVTEDGSIFHGDILVGADGIHSDVRREMWRIADELSPGYFPSDKSHVPTKYCCIFGISNPTDKFPKNSAEQRQGRDHSYLITTGPNERVYWFLFEKLPETTYGLHKNITRYTNEQKDALAAKYASDLVTENLTFGELYANSYVSTLQSLPEVVFAKWHYNRIMTIGDAAHKFNPLSGQGGNSAIEDAAVLADQLYSRLTQPGRITALTDAEVDAALTQVEHLRIDRCTKLMKASHDQQTIQAKETFRSKFFAEHIMPWLPADTGLKLIYNGIRGAAYVRSLPKPQRPHSFLWDDDKEAAGSVDWKYAGYAASAAIAALAVVVGRNSHLSSNSDINFWTATPPPQRRHGCPTLARSAPQRDTARSVVALDAPPQCVPIRHARVPDNSLRNDQVAAGQEEEDAQHIPAIRHKENRAIRPRRRHAVHPRLRGRAEPVVLQVRAARAAALAQERPRRAQPVTAAALGQDGPAHLRDCAGGLQGRAGGAVGGRDHGRRGGNLRADPGGHRRAGLGRILGPKGLMPSTKTGTVVNNIGPTVRNMVGGSEYRERLGVIRMAVGQLGFTPAEMQENIKAFMDALKKDMAQMQDRVSKEVHEVVLSSTNAPGFTLSGEFKGPDSISPALLNGPL
ncbi:hypothetical protein OPT61_g7762 [Boeremia exigua]|uniref:Uncharacterized protein n=1 Tax=Boeremia exigua TaxID=749465 RepID=A0ACC2I1B0_9PLEO|nr:hypothetical protein OPT61_g7762 [Boeremia exigua]